MPQYKKDLFDLDLTGYPYIVYLTAIILVSRIPFINLGFSALNEQTDLDTLSVVNSAYLLRHFQVYTVSRYPGSPVYESLNALLIDGGWLATNAATLFASVVCVFAFGRILNDMKIKNKALLLFTFAFMPIIWINSVITMDYIWALMFILIGCRFAFNERYMLAGLFIGLATGSRFTSALMVIPIVYWMYLNRIGYRNILKFISASIAVSLAVFLPVFHRYGFDFLRGSGFMQTTPVKQSLWDGLNIELAAINTLMDQLIGWFTVLFIIIVVFHRIHNRKLHSAQSFESRSVLKFSLLVMLIFFTLYMIFPYKAAYMIPAVPWALILINESLSRKLMAALCILILINGFISFGITGESEDSNSGGIFSDNIVLKKGPVVQNYIDRELTGLPASKEYMKSISTAISN